MFCRSGRDGGELAKQIANKPLVVLAPNDSLKHPECILSPGGDSRGYELMLALGWPVS